MMIGRYAIESTKPKVFEEAVNFKGAIEGGGAEMSAAATMVTQPRDGETASDSLPEIKANLATLGNVDPKSVTMRIIRLGLVSATYNPETKLVSYKMTQKTYARQVTVIVSATVNARKTELDGPSTSVQSKLPSRGAPSFPQADFPHFRPQKWQILDAAQRRNNIYK